MQAIGARAIEVPARDYGHDLEAMARAVDDETTSCSSPTPTIRPARSRAPTSSRRSSQVPEHVLVVLDEAYNEYLLPDLRGEPVKWLKRHPNLVVTRTFSKVYGLAGLRVGYALAHPSVADLMNRVRQPFNVNSIALAAAAAALDDMEFVARSYAANLRRHAPARGGRTQARPRVHPVARQLRHRAQVATAPRSSSGSCAAA